MSRFEEAINVVLANEGGYVNNPTDPGGETNYGISKRSYPGTDIKALTLDQAKAIYLRDFWLFGGIISQDVANKVFDMYVNAKHDAMKVLQRAVNTPADGSYGPHTESAVNAMDPAWLLFKYRAMMVQHYKDLVAHKPALGKFLNGWINRAKQ